MEIDKFVDLVENMRQAQDTYFKTKNRNAYQRALILERLVDERIKEYNQERKSKIIEGDLFGGNGQ